MSLKDCITSGVEQGIIPARKQADMFDSFDVRKKEYMDLGMSEATAARQAGLDTFDKLKFDKARKISLAVQTARKQAKFKYLLEQSGMNPGEVMERMIGGIEVLEGLQRIHSAEDAIKFFRGIIQDEHFGEFGKVLIEFHQTITGGVRNKAGQHSMLREIIEPGSSGNKFAMEMATAWIRANELLRKLYNERGGAIPKIKGNYIPQHHEQTAVAAVDYKTWRDFYVNMDDFTSDVLDLERMIDYTTGQPFTKETFEIAMFKAYNNIVFQGSHKNTHHHGFGQAMYNKRLDHRFFMFKNADSWLKHNERFGGNNSVFDIMTGHFETMSRDIGLMDVLSPNPDNFIRWMASEVRKHVDLQATKLSAKEFKKLQDRMNTHIDDAEAMYMYLKGSTHAPVNKNIAMTMASIRGVQTSSKLLSATVLAIGDFFFARHTALFAGLPQTQFMMAHLRQILTLPKSELRRIAANSSVVAESYLDVASASARFTAEMTEQHEVMRRVTGTLLKSSGLNWQTQGGRNAAGMEFMAQLAILPKDWKKLKSIVTMDLHGLPVTGKFAEYLEMFGIGAESWKIIKETETWKPRPGSEFLNPTLILNRSDLTKDAAEELAKKLMHARNDFIEHAVPTVNAKAATSGLIIGLGKTQPGTRTGELVRAITQFKLFPMVFHHLHIMRGLNRGTAGGKAKYLVPLVVTTTLMGAMAYEFKQILKGKDISSLDELQDPKYWINAMIHGGGLGYFGDLIFGSRYSAASGAAGVLGAVPGHALDTLDLVFDNLFEGLSTSKKMNLGADLSKYLRRHTPGQSLWYARLAFERLIFDQLQAMIDPKWHSKKRRKIKKTRKEQGTDFWWRPGSITPERPPKFFQ